MSSVIDEEIMSEEELEDLEIKSLKAKLAEIPAKYPEPQKNMNDSLASSLVASFQENPKDPENDTFQVNNPSLNSGVEIYNEDDNQLHTEDDNQGYGMSQKPKNFQPSSGSNLPSRNMLEPNDDRLSSNITDFLSRKPVSSNISFKIEKMTKNEENLSSNISNYEPYNLNDSGISKRNSSKISENNSFNFERKASINNFGTDSNLSHPVELSEKGKQLSSSLDYSQISKTFDSNISFSIHDNLEKISSNLSFESGKENQIAGINKPESTPSDKSKPRAQSSKSVKDKKSQEPIKPHESQKINENIDVKGQNPKVMPEIKTRTKNKVPPKSGKSVKKLESLKKIKEEEVEKENEELKPKSFLIKKMSSKENHKDLLKKINEDYQKKELAYKEKEADLFVKETMEKKEHNDGKKFDEDEKEGKRKKWNADTKVEKFDLDEHKKKVSKMVAESQNRAEQFLLQLQAKMERKVNNFVKDNQAGKENENGNCQQNNNEEMFEEVRPEEGDQLLPNQNKPQNNNEIFEEEEGKNQMGDQLLPEKQSTEKPPKSPETSIKSEEKTQSLKSQEENSEAKPDENTWKYPIGDGQKTEYDKTQNAQKREEKKKTTEIKKIQAETLTTKKQKIMEIEKELRKKQKDINLEQKNNAQLAKPIKALDKAKEKPIIDKPANIQNETKKVEKQEVDTQALRGLKVELGELLRQNKELKSALKGVLVEKSGLDAKIDELKKNQKVICLPNGKFTSFGLVPSTEEEGSKASTKDKSELGSQDVSQNMSINSDEKNKALEVGLIGRIVNKIALGGLTLTQVFELLDYDGDKLLTMNEITMNLPKLNLNLTKEETKELLKQLDSNTDGVINKEEFINCLEKPFEIEQEYYKIMGNIKDIDNPMIMDERRMDLTLRKKYVVEEIGKKEQENTKNQVEYQKMVKKLMKYEKIFDKSSRNTEKHRSEAKKNLESLQITVGELERKLDKMESVYQDKMKEIEENLSFLQGELVVKAEKVIEAKELMERQKNLYQKLQIKQINYDKISETVKRDLELINENEMKLNQLIVENLEIKSKGNFGALKDLYDVMNKTYCCLKIQSFFRMRKQRRQYQDTKRQKLAVKIRVVGKLHRLARNAKLGIFNRKVYRPFLRVMGESYWKVRNMPDSSKAKAEEKERNELYEDQELEKGDEQLPDRDQERSSIMKQLKIGQRMSVEQGENFSPSIIRDKELEDEYLLSTLTIQRKMRARWNAAKKQFAKAELKIDALEHYCTYCKRVEREKDVERICRKCKDPFFCFSCFESYHQSKQTRNHPFYDVGKNTFNLYENEENLKKVTDELSNKLKGDPYEQLQREFMKGDMYQVGLISVEKAENLLNHVMESDRGDIVERMVKMLCKVNTEKTERAAQRFKDANAKTLYDKLANYVDYENLLMMLVSAKEEEEENESDLRKEDSDKESEK